VIETITAGG